jgi:hypothetical protein
MAKTWMQKQPTKQESAAANSAAFGPPKAKADPDARQDRAEKARAKPRPAPRTTPQQDAQNLRKTIL